MEAYYQKVLLLLEWGREHPLIGFVGLSLLLLLLAATPVPNNPISVLLGALFGLPMIPWVMGLVILGGFVPYRLGNRFCAPWVKRKWPQFVQSVQGEIWDKGWIYVLSLRLVMYVPSFAVCTALGLAGVRTRHYILGSVLGTLPSVTLTVCLGRMVANGNAWQESQLPGVGLIFLLLAACPIVMRRLLQARQEKMRAKFAAAARPQQKN